MCRYAGKKYKPHFVCFACRKQFKRAPIEDVLVQHGTLGTYERLLEAHLNPTRRARAERATGETLDSMEQDYRALVSKCPQCGGTMADLGLDFKPPRSSAGRAWTRLHAMYRLGRVWHTCGCNGPGYIPTNQTDYAAYLQERISTFTGMIESAQTDPNLDSAHRIERVRHWSTLLRKVQAELAASGRRAARRAGAA